MLSRRLDALYIEREAVPGGHDPKLLRKEQSMKRPPPLASPPMTGAQPMMEATRSGKELAEAGDEVAGQLAALFRQRDGGNWPPHAANRGRV